MKSSNNATFFRLLSLLSLRLTTMSHSIYPFQVSIDDGWMSWVSSIEELEDGWDVWIDCLINFTTVMIQKFCFRFVIWQSHLISCTPVDHLLKVISILVDLICLLCSNNRNRFLFFQHFPSHFPQDFLGSPEVRLITIKLPIVLCTFVRRLF